MLEYYKGNSNVYAGLVAIVVAEQNHSGHPLYGYAYAPKNEVSEVMREIALVALAQGYRQETLAKGLGRAQPASVMRHFHSAKPHQSTIDSYAKLLNISEQHLRLVQEMPLTAQDEREASKLIDTELHHAEHELREGTVTEAKEVIAKLSVPRRVTLARQVLLENHRWDHGIMSGDVAKTESPLVSYVLRVIATILKPDFDLLSQLRQLKQPRETFLLDLYNLLTIKHNLSVGDAEWFLASARIYLRVHEINTAPMDTYLQKELLNPHTRARQKTRRARQSRRGKIRN